METTFSIQQVAELTGLSIDTLRYYERIGLLEHVQRASSGHRRYLQKDIDWLGLLIDLRETGMPLAQMLHFAELRRQGDATAPERLLLLEQHQSALAQQMQKLEHHMQALQSKIAHKKAVLAQRDATPSTDQTPAQNHVTLHDFALGLPQELRNAMLQETKSYEITTRTITIPVDEETGSSAMDAYMASPVSPGNYRGVIVGFELFGLTGYIRTMVERIAQLGYVVIAPDFYHRTAPGIALPATNEGRTRGFELLHQLTRVQALNDVRATMTYLREEQHCVKTGMVGFSVGGHIAYLAATQFDLATTIAFYPGWLPTQEIPLSQPTPTLSLTPGIAQHNGYLLFLVGEHDTLIPDDQCAHIANELVGAHIWHQFIVYPGASHGFFCDERESFHQASADDAWQRIRHVLGSVLA